MHVLSVDLGTSGPKVGVVASDGRVVDHEFEPVGLQLLPGGGATQDPEEWFQAVISASRRLLRREAVPASSIRAVSVTAQWSGTVAVGHDDRALCPALIWMDSRGARHVEKLVGGGVRVGGYSPHKGLTWLRYTGGAPGLAGKDPLAHILFLKEEHPRIYDDTRVFLEPKDYLNFRLTGAVSATFDSIAMHWLTDNRDPARVSYHPRLFRLAGLDREKFPELIPATGVAGPLRPELCDELGLERGVVVVGGTPDLHSAAIGAGAVRPDDAHLYVGTSSWLVTHSLRKKTDVMHNMAALPAPLPGRYIVVNSQETAGACLSHLRDILYQPGPAALGPAPPDVYQRFDREVQKAPPGSNNLLFLPWLYGERTPVEESTLRGAFFNYSLGTTRADLIRSVYEGVAYNTRWLLSHLEPMVKQRFAAIRFVGGGALSEPWCQIFADVLQREILRVEQPMLANVRGAGLLGMVTLGRCKPDEIAGKAKIDKRFLPNAKVADTYTRSFGEFLALYRANRGIFARLNG